MGDHRMFVDFSTEELEQEVERRKSAKPDRLMQPDWSGVSSYVANVVDLVDDGASLRDDWEDHLVVLVLEAMYGKKILKWWNHKLNK